MRLVRIGAAAGIRAEVPDRPASAESSVPSASPMIWGTHKAVAKTLLWTNILWIALRTYGTPWAALSVIRRMIADRSRVKRWTTRKYARVGGRYFWNLYSPGWPSRAFELYIQRELDRVRPFRGVPPALQSAIVAITKRCALRCEHCCEWDVLNQTETLSSDDLKRVVERLRQRGVAQLFLSGGEPLARFEDLIAIVEMASRDVDVWILTSGVGLTEERAARLAKAGLTGVAISLDHWNPALHDHFRGVRGAYEWVELASEHARLSGLVVALSLCPTRDFVSHENLDRYQHVARSLGASFIQVIEPKPVGRFDGRDVTLTEPQRRLLEEMSDRLNTSRDRLEFPAASYADYASRNSRCFGAGDRYLYVDTDGLLHPCPFCRTPVEGALDGDLDAALARMRAGGCPADSGTEAPHG
jgi:MoaA/NifB/PqqE/SkfB family radical SAM enzyme